MAKIEVSNELEKFEIKLNETDGHWSVIISRYSGESEEVTIPESFGGIPVKTIGDYAFLSCEKLKHVTIPEGVTIIEDSAFSGCTGLTNILLPESLNYIGSWVFSGCVNLIDIILPEKLISIGSDVFENCTSLTKIRIPKSLTSFGGSHGRTGLAEIIVEETHPVICSLDGVMFDKAMTTLMWYPEEKKGGYTVPDGINAIRSNAFDNCRALTSISFPQSLLTIGSYAFNNEQLAAVTVHEANQVYCSRDGVLFRKKEQWLLDYPKGRDGADYTVPDGILVIADSAFSNCKQLTNINFPESLEVIGDSAFTGCEGLKAITLPKSLQFISEFVFEGCTNLETVTLSKQTKIGHKAFEGFTGRYIYRD